MSILTGLRPFSPMEETTSDGDPSLSSMREERVDFVLVWSGDSSEAVSEKSFSKREVFERNLETEGLILSREQLKSKKLNFVKINAPFEILQRYAEIMKIQMPIKDIPGVEQYRKRASMFDVRIPILQSLFGIDPKVFPKADHRMTNAYNMTKHYLFDVNDDNVEKYFTQAIRSRIVHFILKRKKYKDDETDALAFGFERLIASKAYSAGYPLHDGDFKSINCQRGILYKYWGTFSNCLKFQPLDAIKDYFGVKIAIYFGWTGFYTRMLIFPSLLGLICFFYGLISAGGDQYTKDLCESEEEMCPLCDSGCDYWSLKSRCFHSKFTYWFDNDSTAIFAFTMSLWSAVFLDFWIRYSSVLNHRWDLDTFDAKDQVPRPEYLAKLKDSKRKRFNYVTNTVEPAPAFYTVKLPYTLFSYTTMLILITVAIAAVLAVIVYRLALLTALFQGAFAWTKSWELLLVNFTAACLNLIFIMAFSYMYQYIARHITELEIPRTQQDYDHSYAFKLYVFQFVNHYSSLFYIAYFKGNFVGTPNNYTKLFGKWRQEECGTSCMPELCVQLAVIMIGKQAKNSIQEMIIPRIKKIFRTVKLKPADQESIKGSHQQQTFKDYQLLQYGNDELTNEYLEMVLQYGFVTIFVAAFPLAPLFALINNILEVRLDAQKILKYYRRPVALRVKGIGVWYYIVDCLAKFAVLSNAFILAITSQFVPKLVYRYYTHEQDDPKHGTLNGFLNASLCKFGGTNPHNRDKQCSFPAYRHSYNPALGKIDYAYTDIHWKIWFGRVLFVIIFQNVVVLFFLMLRWAIPDTPSELRSEIQREEFLTNELIIQQELLRARGIKSNAICFRIIPSEELKGVENVSQMRSQDNFDGEMDFLDSSLKLDQKSSTNGQLKK